MNRETSRALPQKEEEKHTHTHTPTKEKRNRDKETANQKEIHADPFCTNSIKSVLKGTAQTIADTSKNSQQVSD